MNPAEILMAVVHHPVKIGTITFSLEYRRCGKCSRCALAPTHGPYLYVRDRSGKRKYIGPHRSVTPRELKLFLTAPALTLP